MGRRRLRQGTERGPARAPVRRLLGVSLVPRHGARVVRESRHRPAHERALREREGGSGGAAGRRSDLHAGRAVHDRPRRLADDRVPHARRRPVLRRDVLSSHASPRLAVVPPDPPRHRRRLAQPAQRGPGVLARVHRRAEPRRAPSGLRAAPERRRPVQCVPGHLRSVRRGRRRPGRRAQVPSADDLGIRAALLEADGQRFRAEHGSDDAHEDGAGRDVRPARRGISPLLGGCPLAGASLREDALRQRAARHALPSRLAGVRRRRVPSRLRGDARLSRARDARSCRRLLLGPGRRLRGRGGKVLRLDGQRDAGRAGARRGHRAGVLGSGPRVELRGWQERPLGSRRIRARQGRARAPEALRDPRGTGAPRARRQGAGRVERALRSCVRRSGRGAPTGRLRRRGRGQRGFHSRQDARPRRPAAPDLEGRARQAQGLPRGLRDGGGGSRERLRGDVRASMARGSPTARRRHPATFLGRFDRRLLRHRKRPRAIDREAAEPLRQRCAVGKLRRHRDAVEAQGADG